MVCDPNPTTIADLGANFYLNEADVRSRTPRDAAVLSNLKSLNPFCKVDVWGHTLTPEALASNGGDVLGTGKPFTGIVITQLLPKMQLIALNEYVPNPISSPSRRKKSSSPPPDDHSFVLHILTLRRDSGMHELTTWRSSWPSLMA